LGLVGGKIDNPDLHFSRFAADNILLVVPAAHRWSRRKNAAVAELGSEPLILREPGSGSRRCLERALEHAGLPRHECTAAAELGSNEAIKEAVLSGLGAAFLSRRAVAKELNTGTLVNPVVSGVRLDREFFVVHDQRRALPASARTFLQFIKESPVVADKPGL